MIFIDKEQHEFQIIDFAILCDTRVDDKEAEKIEKYLDLSKKLKKVWNMKVTLVLLVFGALSTPVKALEKRLKKLLLRQRLLNYEKLSLYILLESSKKFLRCEQSC